jgi:low temperature requirement protein LtrA
VLLALYARAIRYVPPARSHAVLMFRVFSLGTVLWLVSLVVPPPGRWWLWACALLIEMATPYFAWARLPGSAVDPRHLPERFGLFTIIVLGESVLSVVLGVAHTSWEVDAGFASAGGFLTAAALWWIYFDFLDESVVARGRISGLVFTFAHFPVLIGIATVGVGVKLEILATAGERRYEDTGWILCVGVAICMIGLAAIHLATPPMLFDADVVARLVTAAIALVLAAASFSVSPLLVVWALAGLLAAQVVLELIRHEGHAGRRVG